MVVIHSLHFLLISYPMFSELTDKLYFIRNINRKQRKLKSFFITNVVRLLIVKIQSEFKPHTIKNYKLTQQTQVRT